MVSKLLLVGVIVGVSAWVGAPVGLLVGLLSWAILIPMFGAIRESANDLETLKQLRWNIGFLSALWFGSGAGSRLLSADDWKKIAVWYFAFLFGAVAVVAVPYAVIICRERWTGTQPP